MNYFYKIFEQNKNKEAIIWNDKSFSYEYLLQKIDFYKNYLNNIKFENGTVTALIGDFTPESISLLFALIDMKAIIVPLVNYSKEDFSEKYSIAKIEKIFRFNQNDELSTENYSQKSEDEFFKILRSENEPGLILFTSGTSGKPKGAIHNFLKLLIKFKTSRTALKTINFLLFDHWGGLNTLFHTLSNGGVVFGLRNRNPDAVCEAIEKYDIEVLPASPTFLNLLIISEAYKRHNLSSLKIISYGTEPMPESLLKRLNELFPSVKIQQTYGLIELGVLRAKSKSPDSLLVKIGGDGFETRVVDGILQIKAESAMLGYLNAPSPFTDDGWFITGDSVEVDGEYFKILGRKTELINVGGEKVYPAEVESVIREMPNIKDVIVFGEKNPITGNVVSAKISMRNIEDEKKFIKKVKSHCRSKMKSYMVPVKIYIIKEELHSERFKKKRN